MAENGDGERTKTRRNEEWSVNYAAWSRINRARARRRRNDGYDVGRRDDTETPVVETRVSRRAPKAPRGGQVRHPKQLLIASVLAY